MDTAPQAVIVRTNTKKIGYHIHVPDLIPGEKAIQDIPNNHQTFFTSQCSVFVFSPGHFIR